MKVERYTIAEFAELLGISKQAVYKRLEKDLSPFVVVEDGKKYILADALKPRAEEPKKKTKAEQAVSASFLLEQIAEKDRLIQQQQETIKQQGEQIKTLEEHAIEQAKATTAILQEQQELQRNYQILLAQNRLLDSSTDETTIEPTVEEVVEEKVETEKEQGELVPKKKRRWWQRKKKG